MTQITPAMINELRKQTGVGMSKCKEALQEAGGDLEAAVVLLRKKGMASAAKKEGREAKEGAVGVAEAGNTVALVEVNAETDFVANNDNFREFVAAMAQEAAQTKPATVEAFSEQKYSGDSELTIDQYRSIVIQKLGENIRINRIALFEKSSDKSIGIYSHMGGKIVALVELNGAEGEEGLARDIAMHVAAARPQYLNSDAVPEDVKQQELDIAREQVKGKPENIMEKILEGKIRAFYDQVCLVSQKYVRDDKVSIQELVDKQAKETGKSLQIANFVCWKVGE